MTWKSFFKPLDSRVTLSAPGLAALALCITVTVITVDRNLSQSKSQTQVVAVSSEEDDMTEDTSNVMLSADLAETVENFILTSKNAQITTETFASAPFYAEIEPSLKPAVIAFAGEKLSQQHRYAEAVDFFSTLSSEQRVKLGSAFAYGYALRALDRDEEALVSYRQHVLAYPNHQAANINLGLLLAKTGNHLEALAVLHHAAEISSGEKRGKALSAQGSSLVALGRFEEAIPVFRKSIEYRPDHSATWRKLAKSMDNAGGFDQAEIESAFQKAVALAPHSSVPNADLGDFYFGKGRFRDAISVYREAHELAKDRLSVGLQRALNLYISDRPTSARRVLRKIQSTKRSASQNRQFDLLSAVIQGSNQKIRKEAEDLSTSRTRGEPLTEALLLLAQIESDPDQVSEESFQPFAHDTTFLLPLRYAYARQLMSAERFTDAEPQLAVLVKSSALSPSFAYAYSVALRANGKTRNAKTAIQNAYQLQPESDRISYELIDQEIATNNFNEALAVLDEVIARKKRPIRAYVQSGDLYLKQGKPQKAIAMYSQVIALGNTDLEIALKLAKLQSQTGSQKEALATIDEAIERESNSVDARFLRAQILIRLNETRGAIEELNKILLLDKDFVPAQEMLTKTQSKAM